MVDAEPAVPNPAAERARGTGPAPGMVADPSEPADAHGAGDADDEAPSGAEQHSRPARWAVRMANAMPDWVGSIRFRLTALYSLLLFGLAAFMMAGLYAFLASRLQEPRLWRTYQVNTIEQTPRGFEITPTEVRASYRSVEALANERALSLLRGYSLTALVILFFLSLLVGWIVAGRVLAPIGRITGVAREIQATDLSRRIALGGPPDELTELADTFDAMLTRLDDAFAGQQRFIQEASHELRNPLAVIRTNLDVALSDPDADQAELRRVAEVVSSAAGRMSRLVDDLLVYARLGAPEHPTEPVSLSMVVEEAADDFRAVATQRHITLETMVAGEVTVAGDRLGLRQAIANLLANAVRLAPEHSAIALAVSTDGDDALVTVADQGPGIDPDDRDKVFQRFWSGDKAAARAEERSGLGLAIVTQVMADHHGTATVEPNDAGGSTFALRLPMAPAES